MQQKNGKLTKRNRYREHAAGGITLMEILIALTIFSMAITVVFSVINQTRMFKYVHRGVGTAVLITDNFLLERKFQQDQIEYFFEKDDQNLIRKGRGDELINQELPAQAFPVTNSGIVFTLICKNQILLAQPFLFRALVTCRWRLTGNKRTNEHEVNVSTIFKYDGGKVEKKTN